MASLDAAIKSGVDAARTQYQACIQQPEQELAFMTPDRVFADKDGKVNEAATKSTFAGAILSDRFEISEYIQSGSFGRGWLSKDTKADEESDHKLVFIKTFRSASDLEKSLDHEELLLRNQTVRYEIEMLLDPAMENIDHENVVRNRVLFGLVKNTNTGEEANCFYVFSRDLCLADLSEFLVFKTRPTFTNFSETSARVIFRQLIAGLDYLHGSGIFHRDLKLENIMVEADLSLMEALKDNLSEEVIEAIVKNPRNFRIKITDFSVSRYAKHLTTVLDQSGRPHYVTTSRVGTPQYCPPELIEEHDEYDPAAFDIWSAGVILFFLLVSEELNYHDIRFDLFYRIIMREPPFDEYLDEHTHDFFHQDGLEGIPRHTKFWSNVARRAYIGFGGSQGVVPLLNGILRLEAKNRLSLEKIKNHPWLTHKPEDERKVYADDMIHRHRRRIAGNWRFEVAECKSKNAVLDSLLDKATKDRIKDALSIPNLLPTTMIEDTFENEDLVLFGVERLPPLIQMVAVDRTHVDIVWRAASLAQMLSLVVALDASDKFQLPN